MHVLTFPDVAYPDNNEGGKSVPGGAVLYGGTVVTRPSWTQRYVASLSSEAEYYTISLADTAKIDGFSQCGSFWSSSGPCCVKFPPIDVFEDNIIGGAIQLAQNHLSARRERPVLTRVFMLFGIWISGARRWPPGTYAVHGKRSKDSLLNEDRRTGQLR